MGIQKPRLNEKHLLMILQNSFLYADSMLEKRLLLSMLETVVLLNVFEKTMKYKNTREH